MQSGFSGMLLVFVILFLLASGFGGYFLYNQQKLHAINSFEDCAKYFPVMESYPAQCNTKDGQHFIQNTSPQTSLPTASPSALNKLKSSITTGSSKDWKVYTNMDYHFSVNFPADWQLVEPEDYYSDIYLYPPLVDINNLNPNTPMMGIRIADERPFADSPKGNLTQNGISMVSDWKQVDVSGLKGIYYQPHQCAPQCNRFVDFPLNEGKGTISIFISTEAQEKGYLPLFEQMYQSFQFN